MKTQKRNILRYNPSPEAGLSKEQVRQRKEEGFVNTVNTGASKTAGEIIRSNIFTYFNSIFFILAAVLLYERSYNNLTFLGVVIANTAIGIVQEMKAKRELEKLQIISVPQITAVREGKPVRVSGDQLVLDDIVVFEAGNQICADAVLCDGTLSVNEALITGEADEVKKEAGDTLLSGSFVVSGKARARLERVGDESFAAGLSKDAKKIKKKQQPGMMKSLTRLIQMIGVIIIPFGVLMFWNQHHMLGLSEKISMENTAAAIIGMIPEGLYLLTSIALAASTVRLAKNNTLVHDMKCIEALARVDVICVDKTGTITEPGMCVKEILPVEAPVSEVSGKLGEFSACMNADNETMKALQEYFKGQIFYRKALRIKGFSSAAKYSAADFGAGEIYVLGAPEFILKEISPDLAAAISEHASFGERTLLFAISGSEEFFRNGPLEASVKPLALVTLSNPVRPQAKETFRYFTEQGVAVKVISGDNPMTAAIAAKAAGIPGAEEYIDVSALGSEEELAKAALKYTVFGRVTPEQKRKILGAIKKSGHTVAMTGDGVNDVLALKDADCSIAMASGSEAAANVSDLVLLDSDFSGMPKIVEEGRRVINNIERSAALFLVKNIFSFLLSVISLISVSLYPLKPAQISLVSALMIGIPSFFLALEPNDSLVQGKFLRNVMFRALPAALTAVFLVEWSLLFADAFTINGELASTMAFFLYSAASYIMLFRVCKPMNLWHGILFALMGAGFLLAIWLIPEWFHIARLDFGCMLILSTLLLLTVPVDRAFQKLLKVQRVILQRERKGKRLCRRRQKERLKLH